MYHRTGPMTSWRSPTTLRGTTRADKFSWRKCELTILTEFECFGFVSHVWTSFFGGGLSTDTSACLFTPTRTARSQSNSRSPCDGVIFEAVILARLLTVLLCLASIYKMFPADKKRVESALAAAHLPKGKVGESPSGPSNILCVHSLFRGLLCKIHLEFYA